MTSSNKNTSCEKCLFSDYENSEEPCKMGVIDIIKDKYQIDIKNNYNYILDYGCRYGFSLEVYQKNKETIGSIVDLETNIKTFNYIKYILIIELTNTDKEFLAGLCSTINSLPILPQFIVFYTVENNNTSAIIETLKDTISPDLEWKLNNFLFPQNIENYISNIATTNQKKNDAPYFWINKDISYNYFFKNIFSINRIINIEQPKTQALIRQELKWDGLFLSFDNYAEIVRSVDVDIIKALTNLENKNLINYD